MVTCREINSSHLLSDGGDGVTGGPLTPALSPSEGEREKRRKTLELPGASGSSSRYGEFSLSPSDGERAGVRGLPAVSLPPSLRPCKKIKIIIDIALILCSIAHSEFDFGRSDLRLPAMIHLSILVAALGGLSAVP